MPTDIKLDDGNGEWVSIDAAAVVAKAADFILDYAPRRRAGEGGPYRRAFVHGTNDELIVNFNGDYPGGVRLNGALLNLKENVQNTADSQLPKVAQVGDLLLLRNQAPPSRGPGGGWIDVGVPQTSLWLCTGKTEITQVAEWSRVSLGESVVGTA